MRIALLPTRVFPLFLVALTLRSDAARAAQPAAAGDDALAALAAVRTAVQEEEWATAWRRVQGLDPRVAEQPDTAYLAAQALFHLGEYLGAAEVRTVSGGRAGQFRAPYLLVEAREGAERFLCCPRAAALYQIRWALDGGVDEPVAHLLHARIWQALGRPQIALSILQSRVPVCLADPPDDVLAVYADLALQTGDLRGYLGFARQRAQRAPERAGALMAAAYAEVAQRCNERGEENLCAQWLARAVTAEPDNPEYVLRLGDTYWSAGRRSEAAPLYRRVLRAAGDHPQTGRLLARLAEIPADAD